MKPIVLLIGLYSILMIAPAGRANAQSVSRILPDDPNTPGAQVSPLGKFLNADGTLNTSPGYSGSLDTRGWRMTTDADGRPRFFPTPFDVQDDPADTAWDDRFRYPGLRGQIRAIANIGADVYVAGLFTHAGGLPAGNIAKWDGSQWSALGAGTNDMVLSLAVNGTDLYAAGDFTTAGGDSAHHIARWDGNAWYEVGSGFTVPVSVLTTIGSDVYAGVNYPDPGGDNKGKVMVWDGGSWSLFGGEMEGFIYALTDYNGDVVAGGSFDTAGGTPAAKIARWNGSAWSTIGSGMNGTVQCLAVIDTSLYAGGSFTNAGGFPANNIARWDGAAWWSLGFFGLFSQPLSLFASGTDLYAGGMFTVADLVPANHVARWRAGAWEALGGGTDADVYAIGSDGSTLWVGGDFVIAGGTNINSLARWNGSVWSPVDNAGGGDGTNVSVAEIAAGRAAAYAGGGFTEAGAVVANHISAWDGTAWDNLDGGTLGVVAALLVAGTDLYVGGAFSMIGGVPASNIAKWDGSSWSALGTGTNGAVTSLAMIGYDLYAGGLFSLAGGVGVSNVARWNGFIWSAVGPGLTRQVRALAAIGPDLYASEASSILSMGAVWRWDVFAWTNIGLFGYHDVFDLAAVGSTLYACGNFVPSGLFTVDASYIAKWSADSGWSQVGAGVNKPVYALTASGNDLYAGGEFDTAGGSPANRIALWDGENWSPLGSGTDGDVRALSAGGTDLYAGGEFTIAGGKPSTHFARWTIAGTPDWSWAHGATGNDFDNLAGVVTDDSGNVYIAGRFGSTSIDFGSGPLLPAGAWDIYLAKYDPDGNLLWAQTAGGTNYDDILGFSIDRDANLYLVGSTESSPMTFDTVSLAHISAFNDVFIAKYDRAGHALWARGAGGSDNEFAYSVTTDFAGNAYVTGTFSSTSIQFGSNPALTNAGVLSNDIFLVKYSPSGTALWSRKDGASGNENPQQISADSAGNTYTVGNFSSASFSFGSNPPLNTNGGNDVFLVKYDTGGAPLWSRSAGGGANDYANCITLDRTGNVYAAGLFYSDSITFGSTEFKNIRPGGSSFDAFFVKYSPAGDFQSGFAAGTWNVDDLTSIAVDDSGNVYLAGYFGDRSFPIGRFTVWNTTSFNADAFVAKFDSGWRSLWIKPVGGRGDETPVSIAVDPGGNIVVGGSYYGLEATFGSHVLPTSDMADVFVAKIGSAPIAIQKDQSVSLQSGWNLVSLPVDPSNDSVGVVYPGATSSAFAFTPGGYATQAVMAPGTGYWLKFASPSSAEISGVSIPEQSVAVFEGWNLVGSISDPLPVSSVTSTPPGLVTSNFYDYHGSYSTSDTIHPGYGYWVKVSADGLLHLSTSPGAAAMNRIQISPTSELPPPPPSDGIAVEPVQTIPAKYALRQNFPNPFNPSTKIRFDVPEAGIVSLVVYDVLGREVTVLANQAMEPGYRMLEWDASGQSGGVYFLKMTAGTFSSVKKMLLIR